MFSNFANACCWRYYFRNLFGGTTDAIGEKHIDDRQQAFCGNHSLGNACRIVVSTPVPEPKGPPPRTAAGIYQRAVCKHLLLEKDVFALSLP